MNRFDCYTSEDPTFTLPESVSIAYDTDGVSVYKISAQTASPIHAFEWKNIRGFRSEVCPMDDDMDRLQIDTNLGHFEFECDESPRNVELMNATLQMAVSEHKKKETHATLQQSGINIEEKKMTALELIRESSKYAVYNMMLKMGLPLTAVRHKMHVIGMPEVEIEAFCNMDKLIREKEEKERMTETMKEGVAGAAVSCADSKGANGHHKRNLTTDGDAALDSLMIDIDAEDAETNAIGAEPITPRTALSPTAAAEATATAEATAAATSVKEAAPDGVAKQEVAIETAAIESAKEFSTIVSPASTAAEAEAPPTALPTPPLAPAAGLSGSSPRPLSPSRSAPSSPTNEISIEMFELQPM
jgi:hypothetical protein